MWSHNFHIRRHKFLPILHTHVEEVMYYHTTRDISNITSGVVDEDLEGVTSFCPTLRQVTVPEFWLLGLAANQSVPVGSLCKIYVFQRVLLSFRPHERLVLGPDKRERERESSAVEMNSKELPNDFFAHVGW